MKILITGGEGFIGRNLYTEMSRFGHNVKIIDRPDGDLTIPGVFLHYLNKHEPDVVVHLAAQVGRLFGEDDLIHTINSNATMTTLVARACGENDIPLLYASTSEVYGDNGDGVCDEYEGPFSLPHNLYGLSKKWGEEACQLYAPKNLKIIRLSMPYGPGVPPGRGRAAITNMLWQASTRQDIPVHVGAERSWCNISDIVRAIRYILHKRGVGIWNVGRDDDSRPMLDIAHRACLMTDCSRNKIKLIDPPPNQTVVKRLSTDRIRSLGWSPRVPINEGMKILYEWTRQFDEKGDFVGI